MEKDTFARKREKIVKVSLGTDKAVFTAHICSKGRIVIPKEVRDALSIEEGCLLRCKIGKAAYSDARLGRWRVRFKKEATK